MRTVVKVTQQTELEYDIFQGCITSQDTDYFHLRGLISCTVKLHNANAEAPRGAQCAVKSASFAPEDLRDKSDLLRVE